MCEWFNMLIPYFKFLIWVETVAFDYLFVIRCNQSRILSDCNFSELTPLSHKVH